MIANQATPVEVQLLRLLNRLRKVGPGPPPIEEVGVTPAQLILLDWVAELPGCGIQDMAAGLGLAPPTVSVGVGRLEEAGLLERRSNPEDARSIRLFLTARGQAVHQRAQDFRRQKARQMLTGLTPQEQETLVELLERAISAAEARADQ